MVVTTDVNDPRKYERRQGKVITRRNSLSLWSDACIRPKPRGLLPSGALVVHPIKLMIREVIAFILQGRRYASRRKMLWAYAQTQVFDHSLGGYSHREHWSCTRWQFRDTLKKWWLRFNIITYSRSCTWSLHIYSHRERCVLTQW